ncbi:MAG: MFS transporter [Pseudomonadota bacterium]
MEFLKPLQATLEEPNYRRYTFSNAFSLVGTWVQRVAVGWLTWELTGSATWLGVMAAADLLPVVLLGPLGGAVADRRPPLDIVRWTQIASLVVSAIMTVLTGLGLIDVTWLAILVLMQGLAMGFGQPARLALVYRLVSREHLPSAIAFNAVVFNSARFVGPMLAGAALVASGPAAAFAFNTLSFVAFIFVLYRLELSGEEPGRRPTRGQNLADEVVAGTRYALSHARIGPVLVLSTLMTVAIRPYVELLPGFADRVFSGGAAELAMMSSAVGLGAIVAGLMLAARGTSDSGMERVFVAAGGAALSVLLFAMSESFVLALVFLTLSGGAISVAAVTAQTTLQLHVSTEFRARVMSLYGMIARSGPALGALLMGAAADWVGMRLPVVAGAGLALLAGLWFWQRLTRA